MTRPIEWDIAQVHFNQFTCSRPFCSNHVELGETTCKVCQKKQAARIANTVAEELDWDRQGDTPPKGDE